MGGAFTEADNFCCDLRRLQQRSKCSDQTCNDILKTFAKYLRIDVPCNLRKFDKTFKKEAGAEVLRLNGCVGCHKQVYLPRDRTEFCPRVKADGTVCGHPRYKDNGKPHEVRTLIIYDFFSLLKTILVNV